MKIALVAMPWSQFDSPSTALGTLSALLRREYPHFAVDCHYGYVDMWQRIKPVYERISNSPFAEIMFLPLLYPRERGNAARWFAEMSEALEIDPILGDKVFDQILHAAKDNVDAVVASVGTNCDLVGFTITYCQLFSSLAVSRKLKQNGTTVVFGGAGVDLDCGLSVLRQFSDTVDYIVRGEGERPFLALIEALRNSEDDVQIAGVLTPRLAANSALDATFTPKQRLNNLIEDINELPIPDYREYAELADIHRICWHVSMEGSRGCWWNSSLKRNNPLRACYFCSLNLGSYREKTAARVATEVRELTHRHTTARIRFMDNVMRKKGLVEVLDAIEQHEIDLRLIAEVRASITPYELCRLWEVGCHHVQIGIEGLSTDYLRRLGKGATTIQNLQAMKTCFELGIQSGSNLMVNFPGATREEIEETVFNIDNYAIAYEPPSTSEFALYPNSSIHARAEAFGISNMRNHSSLCAALPDDVAKNLSLHWLEFDYDGEVADWTPVQEAIARWRGLHQVPRVKQSLSQKPLFYTDGGTFLEIVDRRIGFQTTILDGDLRQIYLYCMQIRSKAVLFEHFALSYEPDQIQEMLDGFIAAKLMYQEKGRLLSLAPAVRPLSAVRRIRKAHCASEVT